MKLKNKKTGKIREIKEILIDGMFNVNSLAELNEEWEDYEEPTGYWYIDFDGDILGCVEDFGEETDEKRKQIGNYFETEEEAEKAVEKLKAWKRLEDKGWYFKKWEREKMHINVELRVKEYDFLNEDVIKDLDLLFGGEE